MSTIEVQFPWKIVTKIDARSNLKIFIYVIDIIYLEESYNMHYAMLKIKKENCINFPTLIERLLVTWHERWSQAKIILTFFVVIEELGGTTQTDHLDSRTSKTHVSGCPEESFLSEIWPSIVEKIITSQKETCILLITGNELNLPWYINDVKEWSLRFFLLPPPAIYHLVPQRAPQQPARGDGWWPWVLTLDHTI